MAVLNDVLSIWEVAHRWHNQNPFTSDSKNLPLEVHDRIYWLIDLVLRLELHLTSVSGVRFKNETDLKSFDDFERELRERLSPEELKKVLEAPDKRNGDPFYSKYLEYQDRVTYKHSAAVQELEQELKQKRFSRKVCDHRYVDVDDVYECCGIFGEDPPEFWSDYYPSDITPAANKKEVAQKESPATMPKSERNCPQEQLAQVAIQGAARAFFELTDLTPDQISEHEIIQIQCNRENQEKEKIRLWISEVNPNESSPVSNKPPEDEASTEPEKDDANKCRQEVMDRIAIQAAARVFFQFAKSKPYQVRAHDIIRIQCNGKQWKENTLARWISAVDPKKGQRGGGRPAKKTESDARN